jgi:hypothetical protein
VNTTKLKTQLKCSRAGLAIDTKTLPAIFYENSNTRQRIKFQ